jgi:hypothetical protein
MCQTERSGAMISLYPEKIMLFIQAVERLLECTELNQDDIEPDTQSAIAAVHDTMSIVRP